MFSMKTTNFRTVEELNLDVNAPAVTPTKVQNDKIVRALKKLSLTNPDETLIVKIVSAFVALGVNPQAKSSSWLARRLKNHLQAFGLAGAPAQAVAEEPAEEAVQEPATEQRNRQLHLKPRRPRKLRKRVTPGTSAGIRVVISAVPGSFTPGAKQPQPFFLTP
jgi:hypothetical protein